MKTEELKAQGLTEEQISFVMAENGKDLKKLQKENDNLSADLDTWKGKAEAAETTLKGFEGVDLKTMQKELSDWKQKATEAEKKAQKQIYERDFADALKTEFEGIKFSSEAAKRAIMAEVKEAGLKLKDGKILGLNDLISHMKEKDASAFIDEGQQKAQQNAARFTQPFQRQNQSGGITKDQIMGIKDASERQSAIAANIHLFGKGE
ncbi:MAG: phage scaffolding protein [Enterocloster clostridioformis]|uniref:phage scaffolding protein n=1 Tax=Enterocloster clostridioformis TaxID=1531 RepID=UPI001D3F0CCE|nr:phage scaffolding protein [Enterocloster clostridioformis]MBS7003276.1 phage scaffolding protein [Enterocloster clostridioformis]